MDNLHQTTRFADFIRHLGWKVIRIDQTNMFVKSIPLAGTFAKIQRITKLPPVETTLSLLQSHHVNHLILEASDGLDEAAFRDWSQTLGKKIHLIQSPYIPTKTLRIDLSKTETAIFQQFSEAKRRAVRRAEKNLLRIEVSTNIEAMIKLKNRAAGFLGFITTRGTKQLWDSFAPDQAVCVLAYAQHGKQPIAGILLLFNGDICYYWIAGATREGKKLFAPTLVAWEAIKVAKDHGALWFDWVGIFDERFPNDNSEWKGFTKFKLGFGGMPIYYPVHRTYEVKSPTDND